MKLKQITKLLLAIFLVFVLGSCNSSDDDTEYSYEYSADAQIHSFSVSTIKSTDSVNYKIISKARFSIDQYNKLIYNPDSLPYGTKRAKYYASVGLTGGATPEQIKTQLLYLNNGKDSIVDWTGTDSVDFSTPKYPKFIVTAPNGQTKREYVVDIRIHQVDPDTINWTKVKSLEQSSASVGRQKTFLYNNVFYTFSIDSDNKFYLRKAPKSTAVYSTKAVITAIPNVKLESITLFNNEFFALDNVNKAYRSSDGMSWSLVANNVESILGILPNIDQTKNTLLVVTNSGGTKKFATTTNMTSIQPAEVAFPLVFPEYGFSSVTNYDSEMASRNILTVTGGYTGSGYTNITHYFTVGLKGELQHIQNQANPTFGAKQGITCFMYDNYMYALTGNQFYKSSSWGSKWVKATQKEMLDPNTPKAYGQSVIIDNDNYIWIFGGMTDSGNSPVQQVWKGRLNKLNPKN